MPEQSEGNNHTSKINLFPVLHTIFFLLAGQKVDLFAPHGTIKSTLWPASRKMSFVLFPIENLDFKNHAQNNLKKVVKKKNYVKKDVKNDLKNNK